MSEIDWTTLVGRNVRSTHASDLPQLIPPETICLHLGYPDPAVFPGAELAPIFSRIIERESADVLQYAEPEGDRQLRETIGAVFSTARRAITPENVIITHGTTEAIDIVGRLLINEGDVVLMESPTYLWAIRAFQYAGARLVGVAGDNEGILLKDLERRLQHAGQRAKILYLMPDFQNPSGRTMSLERRMAVLEIATRHRVVILEDTPYRDLNYGSEALPTLYELDTSGSVLMARSFSKSIGPGMRLGWVAGSQQLVRALARLKLTGTCTVVSRAAARYLASPGYEAGLVVARGLYRAKHDAMDAALELWNPGGVTWKRPEGGFYFWLDIPPELDVDRLFNRCTHLGVLFLKGRDFFCGRDWRNALRLSFSYETPERIGLGCQRLMQVIGGGLE